MHRSSIVFAFVLLSSVAAAATAQTDASPESAVEDSITVVGRKTDLVGDSQSASEISVGFEDFRLRPLLREAELLETNPGMIATQHSGGGKSNQLFLRGFNLDHGTDFHTSIEGMPVNMPTHGHGHGYTDLNFLIPELVERIDFQKGPYFADAGDFSSAGTASIRLRREFDGPILSIETGEDVYRRAVVGASERVGPGTLLVGAEVKAFDGPWVKPQNLKKLSGVARYSLFTDGGDRVTLTGMTYDNEWQSSDQIPLRAIEAGTISRFGQIDSTLGGASSRHSLSLDWDRTGSFSSWRAGVYGIAYDLELYSNFTYFAEDSANGDQIQQIDDRTILGGYLAHDRELDAAGMAHTLSAGLSTRADLIDEVALHRSRKRERIGTVREDEVTQLSSGAYGSLTTYWSSRLRSVLGVRMDHFLFDVTSVSDPINSGDESDVIVSPKAGLVATLSPQLETYANAGLGFHSNDARGTVISIDPATDEPAETVDPTVRSRGAEIGVRFSSRGGLRTTVAGWVLELDSELLFVGDAGATEPSDKSRRSGIEITNFLQLTPWLSADLDLSFTQSRFVGVGSEDRIPGALENVIAAGVMWDHPTGIFGALRLRHLGEYPLIEDNSVRADATTLINASLGVRVSDMSISVSVLNLSDEERSDIQYFYESQLPGESAPVEDVHLHPVEPLQARLRFAVGI